MNLVSGQPACETIGALADGKAVWFWHPLLVLNSRRLSRPDRAQTNLNPRMTVTRRIRRRGEHEISRKTIARGMPGQLGEPVVTTLVCFILFRTRGCGCSGHPAFPAPSLSWANGFANTRAHRAARWRTRVGIEATLLRGATCPPWLNDRRWKRRSNPLLLRSNMDCFACARNDDKTTQARHRSADRRVAGAGR
jgi:hypothetical protein